MSNFVTRGRYQSVIAGITTIALATGLGSVVANAETKQVAVPFVCNLTTPLPAPMDGMANGEYLPEKKYHFDFTMNATAPTSALVGENFDYVLEGGKLSIENPIMLGGVLPIRIVSATQGRFLLNTGDVEAVKSDLNSTIENGQVRLNQGTDTDAWDLAPKAADKWVDGGWAGQDTEDKKHFDLVIPKTTLTYKSDKVGDVIRPSLPMSKRNSNDPKSAFSMFARAEINLGDVPPGHDDMIKLLPKLGIVAVNNRVSVKAVVRCRPHDKTEFPGVTIKGVTAEDIAAGQKVTNLKLVDVPTEVAKNGKVTLKAVATNAAGGTVTGAIVKFQIGNEVREVATDANGVATLVIDRITTGVRILAGTAEVFTAPAEIAINNSPSATEAPNAEATPSAEATPTAEPTPGASANPSAEPTPSASATPSAEATPTEENTPKKEISAEQKHRKEQAEKVKKLEILNPITESVPGTRLRYVFAATDESGQPVEGAPVTVIVAEKRYERVTNARGVAYFDVSANNSFALDAKSGDAEATPLNVTLAGIKDEGPTKTEGMGPLAAGGLGLLLALLGAIGLGGGVLFTAAQQLGIKLHLPF